MIVIDSRAQLSMDIIIHVVEGKIDVAYDRKALGTVN